LTNVGELRVAFTGLDSLGGLRNLKSAGSVLLELNPELSNLDDLGALERVDTTLRIYFNGKLSDLRGLSALRSAQRLEVIDNLQLPSCEVDRLVTSIGPANVGTVVATGNDPNLPCMP
jgi:hypothetical protein